MWCVVEGRWTPFLPAAAAMLVPVPGFGKRCSAGRVRWLEEKGTRLGVAAGEVVASAAVGAESSGGRRSWDSCPYYGEL